MSAERSNGAELRALDALPGRVTCRIASPRIEGGRARMDDAPAVGSQSAKSAVTPTLPPPTPQQLIDRAIGMRPMLRAQQEEADRRGVYTDEVHQALLAGGFYRVVCPKMFGGYEFAYPD